MVAELDVTLDNEFAPFLRPNQYVNYVAAPNTVIRGAELCVDLSYPLEKVAAVYDYVVQNIRYDEEKAATVQSGYLPDLDEILKMNNAVRNMIRDNKNHQIDSVIASGSREGMVSMDQAIAVLCRAGKISRETALHYAGQPEQMKRLIQ